MATTTDLQARHHVEHVMGMAVSIDVRDDVSEAGIDEVVAWLHHVDATFSTYKVDSPITIAQTAEKRGIHVVGKDVDVSKFAPKAVLTGASPAVPRSEE